MQRYRFFLLVFLMSSLSCQKQPASQNVLENLLKEAEGAVANVMADPEKYEVQILYTQIDRDENNNPSFTSYEFRVDENEYFYPASTVKLPVAIMAMEKLNRLNIDQLDLNSRIEIDSAFSGQSAVLEDTTSESGFPTIGHYIKKILLVSDNDGFNRLYEFVGQKEVNQALQEKGLTDSRITHRLSIALSEEENRHTNPMKFYDGEKLIYDQPQAINDQPIPHPTGILKGKGEMSGGELIEKPKDFSAKNAFTIADQQRVVQEIFFPGSTGEKPMFDLTESDYQFLYQYMSQLPAETSYPAYDREHYYDSYVKFFMFGDSKDPIPQNIRVFDKVGLAYGFLIDNAYIADFENGVEFLITATISVNENQIFNDNNYEYDEIGFPFLGELGRIIYEYEKKRPRAHKADLSRFSVEYDKPIEE